MPVYHRTQRLQIYGEKPEVTQLFNDRYRIVVRCKAARDTEAWYNDNKSQIFADFGTLYNAQMSIDGIDSRTGEAYDNMVLVSNAVGYTQTGEYVVTFVYETLTATWTKEQEDTVSSTDNGLRVVERSEVATIEATAPYDEDDIGVSTITSGGKTLYLAGFKDETKAESDAQIGRVTTQWLEAGILSIDKDYVSEGVCRVTTTFLVTEQTVDGPIIGRAIGDNDGLKTIAVTHMQKSDGTSLIDNSNAVVSHKILDNFTYPGTVRLDREGLSGNNAYSFAAVDYALESPVNAKIPAVMEIHFRTNDTRTYPLGYPLWNPTEWAYGESKGIAWNYVPFSISRAFRGYRTTSTDAYAGNNLTGSGASGSVGGASWDMISGKRIFAGTTFHIFVEGGPENPVGNNYTLDYKISEAFQDLDGTKYYKHVIIKTDGTVPAQ